jgi:hypothetical protein
LIPLEINKILHLSFIEIILGNSDFPKDKFPKLITNP